MKHRNIAVFIPHLGCPNDCVFCNQRSISGTERFDEAAVPGIIEASLKSIESAEISGGEKSETEIAFFGGSFTGIDRVLMIRLLSVAKGYIDSGRVNSIRLSTRPDYIDSERIDILKSFGVGTVELGIQSTSENVLRVCRRGHTVTDTVNACRMVTEAGFKLVGQMMTGLPGSEIRDEIHTAETIVSLGASGARIYPTAVFAGTELDRMRQRGEYVPPSLEEQVRRAAAALGVFRRGGVGVIRIGLCENEGLHGSAGITAGVSHPAFGDLCESMLMREKIEALLPTGADLRGKILKITTDRRSLSYAAGHGGMNRIYFTEKYGLRDIKLSGNGKSNEPIIELLRTPVDYSVFPSSAD